MNLEPIYRGDDCVLTATVLQADGVSLVDLTGLLGAQFTLKRYLTDLDAEALLTKTLGAGIAITGAGTLEITLTPADTEGGADTLTAYTLKIKNVLGQIKTVAEGEVLLKLTAIQTM